MENGGNFIAHQTTHYLKTERVIDLVHSTKGTDIYPFLAFSAGLKQQRINKLLGKSELTSRCVCLCFICKITVLHGWNLKKKKERLFRN